MFRVQRSWVSIFTAIVLVTTAGLQAGARGADEARSVREVTGFDSVILATSGELIITQGDREQLELVARGRDLPLIVTEVRDGTLSIGWDGTGPAFSLRPPVYRLTVKTIASLETRSSGRIVAGSLRSSALRIRISSSGSISIDSLACESLDAQIVSSGSLGVAGRVEQQTIRLSSSGSYFGKDLASGAAIVRVSSSGGATLRATDSLEATVTSSGDARYYGSPRVTGKATSSGRLVRLGD